MVRFCGKCFESRRTNILPMLLFTLLEKCGLNHIIFCFLFFCSLLVVGAIQFNASLKPLSFKASLYGFIDSSKISLLDDVSDIRFSIDFGNCLRMLVGWLECLYKLACCFLCEMVYIQYYLNQMSHLGSLLFLNCIEQ